MLPSLNDPIDSVSSSSDALLFASSGGLSFVDGINNSSSSPAMKARKYSK